jgi:hypothetical protein
MNVRLKYDAHIISGVFYDGMTRMNNYSVRVWMTTNTSDPNSHNTAFERIKFFLFDQLDSTVFINSQNHEQCQRLINAGLKVTTLPGEPVDQLIGIMLYYKLNAITEERMIIDEVEISSILGDSMTYLHSALENTDIINKPDWWQNPDPVHCDTELTKNSKVVSITNSNTWRELDLLWGDSDPVVGPGETVVFADFKRTDENNKIQ